MQGTKGLTLSSLYGTTELKPHSTSSLRDRPESEAGSLLKASSDVATERSQFTRNTSQRQTEALG